MSWSLTETVLQILSEEELVATEPDGGSAVKCGTMKTKDPIPIITAPDMNKYIIKIIYFQKFGITSLPYCWHHA